VIADALIEAGEQRDLRDYRRSHGASGDLGRKPVVEDVELHVGFVELKVIEG
jgi:hypothetical protein